MFITQSILINASPEKIWEHIADPQKVMAWNPKIVHVDKYSMGEFTVGYRYQITYRMSNKENRMDAEIILWEKPNHLKILCKSNNIEEAKFAGRQFIEEYILTIKEGGTLLKQKIDLTKAKMPWILAGIVWFIMKFGKPIGPQYLDKLKEIVEKTKI